MVDVKMDFLVEKLDDSCAALSSMAKKMYDTVQLAIESVFLLYHVPF